jgi:hypothetical protein
MARTKGGARGGNGEERGIKKERTRAREEGRKGGREEERTRGREEERKRGSNSHFFPDLFLSRPSAPHERL